MAYYIGIDPGKQGGIAWIESYEEQDTYETRYHRLSKATDKETLEALEKIAYGKETFVVLEDVCVFSKDGAKSATTFMLETGKLRGYLTALGLDYQLVRPQKWQPMFGAGSNKRANLALATSLDLADDTTPLEVCDALLLAEYCRRIHEGYRHRVD